MVGRGLGNYIRAFFDFNQVSVQPDEMCLGRVRGTELGNEGKVSEPFIFFPSVRCLFDIEKWSDKIGPSLLSRSDQLDVSPPLTEWLPDSPCPHRVPPSMG